MVRVGVALGATARAASTALRRQNVLKLPRQFGMGNLEVAFDALIPNSKFLLPDSCYFAFSLRRAAQYFFIRSDTALRAAADIPLRRRRAAPLPAPFRTRPATRSGNARRIAASSRRSSSRRDFAPSRANRCNSTRLKSATNPPYWTSAGHTRPTCWPVILTFALISVKPAYMGTRGLGDLGTRGLGDLGTRGLRDSGT